MPAKGLITAVAVGYGLLVSIPMAQADFGKITTRAVAVDNSNFAHHTTGSFEVFGDTYLTSAHIFPADVVEFLLRRNIATCLSSKETIHIQVDGQNKFMYECLLSIQASKLPKQIRRIDNDNISFSLRQFRRSPLTIDPNIFRGLTAKDLQTVKLRDGENAVLKGIEEIVRNVPYGASGGALVHDNQYFLGAVIGISTIQENQTFHKVVIFWRPLDNGQYRKTFVSANGLFWEEDIQQNILLRRIY
ncbi:MAG: hypothetical protein HC799_15340 [Limnothrix sp. RL_2_0]|nr:hypothetical protein [Limnothrix sp. RL_2_0]